MREPSLPERARAHLPAAGRHPEGRVEQTGCRALETGGEAQLRGASVQEARLGLSEQFFAEAVRELEEPRVVEREDGDVDLPHDLGQQGSGLEGSQALVPECRGESIDLQEHLAQRIVGARSPRADREVFLAHGGEQVGDRLQRDDDALAQRVGAAEPPENDERGERPAHLRRHRRAPEENESDEDGRQGGQQGVEQDAAVVREAAHRPSRSRRR